MRSMQWLSPLAAVNTYTAATAAPVSAGRSAFEVPAPRWSRTDKPVANKVVATGKGSCSAVMPSVLLLGVSLGKCYQIVDMIAVCFLLLQAHERQQAGLDMLKRL